MKSKCILFLLAILLVFHPCKKAKAQTEYIIPTTLISYGVLAQFVPALDDFDLSIREGFSSFNQNKCKCECASCALDENGIPYCPEPNS